jgi:hypothetical protein
MWHGIADGACETTIKHGREALRWLTFAKILGKETTDDLLGLLDRLGAA